jgi:hypothetical protein
MQVAPQQVVQVVQGLVHVISQGLQHGSPARIGGRSSSRLAEAVPGTTAAAASALNRKNLFFIATSSTD